VKGMVHVTGGGLVENTPRVFAEGLGCVIDRATWKPQPVFEWMRKLGQIEEIEMYRTFNMGVGLVIVAAAGLEQEIAGAIAAFPKLRVWKMGVVEAGSGVRFGGV
jgi:phosphoribosylaminoimidazole (AIR) synthetase